MKIALECGSELLQKSLVKFLDGHLVPKEEAELIVSDREIESPIPVLRIGTDAGADLLKPFSRSQLMIRIEEMLQKAAQKEAVAIFEEDEEESLEEKIERATRSFVEEIVAIVREHREKRP